jgi:4-hydroxy-4-methyl-2-oxoglutarate aldolase
MTDDKRKKLLLLYEDLRVTDVRDGMDTMMRHNWGSMGTDIRPLYRTRAFGIARTCRYVPYRGDIPRLSPREYWDWVAKYYAEVCPYPWVREIKEGDFIVIDQSGIDVGLMGSNNGLDCFKRGAHGLVTNGGVRDTDELILQKVPFWSRMISQPMVQGRLQFDAKDIPVSVGGVLVHPGDVVVADGDGIVVVPQDIAEEVARYAHAEHERDKKTRLGFYEDLGWKPDETVKPGE